MSRALLPIVPSAVAMLFAAWAAVCDLRTRRIPNRLVLLGLPAALLTQFFAAGWKGVAGSAAAAATALVLMSVAYFLGGMGAGDVKLIGVMGAFSGLPTLALLLIGTALAGGVVGVIVLGKRAYASQRQHDRVGVDAPPFRPLTIPYALPIASGVLAVFCHALRSLA